MIYHITKDETNETKNFNFESIDNKEEIENYQKIWKNIKSLKIKKMLLSNFIDNINKNIDDKLIVQKNKLLLKSLHLNLKYIDEDNIILKNGEIVKIIGVNINEKGLLLINNFLYKNKKIPR